LSAAEGGVEQVDDEVGGGGGRCGLLELPFGSELQLLVLTKALAACASARIT